MEIKKINELKNIESFLQINFVKGFKYIDKAGEIINIFDKIPKYINPDGLWIDKTKTEQIRITPFTFWSHFTFPGSLGQISDDFINDAEKILRIIDIDELTRIGWRNYFIYTFNNDEEIKNVSNKFIQKEGVNFEAIFFSYKEDKIDFNFNIRKFVDEKDKKTKLLIDIDSFKYFNKDVPLELNNGKNVLKEIREKIQSKSFLNIINFILTEKNG